MSTSSGVAYFEEPSELLQLLVLTVEASTSPIHNGADVLREHSMARYDAAAQRIDPAAPTWRGASAIFSDARSMSELGILKLLQVSDAGTPVQPVCCTYWCRDTSYGKFP